MKTPTLITTTAILLLIILPGYAADLPEAVTTVEGITEYRLDNGLRVLLFPDPSKPTVTINITYLVGSRHEGRGEAGMAHLLEHMVFKGTPTYENIWGALEDHGANFNGTTWVDRTNYYETLPASDENLEFALHMEADRMVNSAISADELAKEMTVVRNEFEMGENSPFNVLTERMSSAAYLWHNYGKSTIGNRSDIERVPAENLRAFYERYYQPDNAVLVVAGKFDPDDALTRITKHFGAIAKPNRVLATTYTEEPVQDGPRFVTVKRVGDTGLAGICYHVPAAAHEEFPAVAVLQEILTSQPAGRLYKALVEPGEASSVVGFAFAWAEPGLMASVAEFQADADPDSILETMTQVAENLGDAPITEEEVERVKTRLLKDIKLALADSGRIGIQLSEWTALGDWRMFFLHRDRIKAVTAADVQAAADHYLVESNRTAGVFIPTKGSVRAEVPPAPLVAGLVEGYEGSEEIEAGEVFAATPANIDARTERYTLRAGVRVGLLAKGTRGEVVHGNFNFHFGTETSLAGQKAAFDLLPSMLMRGTSALDYQGLRDEIDRLQSRINVTGTAGVFSISIESDGPNILDAIALAGTIVQSPRFDSDQFDIIKKERITSLENSLSDPQGLGFSALSRAMNPWPEDSVHYVATIPEQIAALKAVTVDDLAKIYKQFYGASNAEMALVGDFDSAAVKTSLQKTFGTWDSPAPYVQLLKNYRPSLEIDAVIDTPDKQMAIVGMAGTIELVDGDPDYPALDFATYILGQSAKSRLMNRLRHKGGLSYGAGGFLQVRSISTHAGLIAYAICAPQNAQKALDAMREEMKLWLDEGLTQEELDEGKISYALNFDNQLASDKFVSSTIARNLEIDRGFSFYQAQIDAVQQLENSVINDALKRNFGALRFMTMNAGDVSKAEAE